MMVKQTPIRTCGLKPKQRSIKSVEPTSFSIYTIYTGYSPAIMFLKHNIKHSFHGTTWTDILHGLKTGHGRVFLSWCWIFLHNTMEGERKTTKQQALEKWGTLAPGWTTQVFGMWQRYSTADGGLQEIQYCTQEHWFREDIMLPNLLPLSLLLAFSSFSSRSSCATACTRSKGCTERLRAAEETSPPRWCSHPPRHPPPTNTTF